jgi:hypothetical protein
VKKKFVFAKEDYTDESPEAAEYPDKKAMKEQQLPKTLE